MSRGTRKHPPTHWEAQHLIQPSPTLPLVTLCVPSSQRRARLAAPIMSRGGPLTASLDMAIEASGDVYIAGASHGIG